jgi:hypothetical protein
VLAVTFAASTSVLTPIGYQTKLVVYGPGGYRVSDYFRVGAPLQVLMLFHGAGHCRHVGRVAGPRGLVAGTRRRSHVAPTPRRSRDQERRLLAKKRNSNADQSAVASTVSDSSSR